MKQILAKDMADCIGFIKTIDFYTLLTDHQFQNKINTKLRKKS